MPPGAPDTASELVVRKGCGVKQYLNIEELARLIHISKSQLYCMTSQHRIPFTKVGRRVLFDPEDIERWLSSHRVAPRAPEAEDVSEVLAQPRELVRCGKAKPWPAETT